MKQNKPKNINKFICAYSTTGSELKNLSINNADVPVKNKIYTLKKCFYHIAHSIRGCKFIMQFKELNHGDLIGYNVNQFRPVDKLGNIIDSTKANIKISKEINPKWVLNKNGRIISSTNK